MDKASFEIVGNVGSLDIRSFKSKDGEGRLATLSIATGERWTDQGGDRRERTYWHRVTVFAPAMISRLEAMVQKGTRVRLVGRIRPGSYEDAKGQTRYVVELVLGPGSDLEILARGKPRTEAPVAEEAA